MKKIIFSLLALLIASQIAYSQQSNSVKVTVYNQNLGVIKETREVDIKRKTDEIRITDVAENIDPTSVGIQFDGTVLEQNYQYDLVSMGKILEKYIDKEITLISKENVISGVLLSVNRSNIVLRKKKGGLVMLPKYDEYRVSVGELPEGLITKPTLFWIVNANKTGKQDVEFSYMTEGMNWHAEYVAILNEDDTKMDMNSWVSIENNAGAAFKDADLKLVAGDVHRVSERGYGREAYSITTIDNAKREQMLREKDFFEYHIYELKDKTTLANRETKQISLFEADQISIEKKFKYRSYWEKTKPHKVLVFLEFENTKKNNMGMPLPKGKVRMYKSDGESVEFIGEDMINHIPRNETVTLKVGNAFDVVVEEKKVDEIKIAKDVREFTFEYTIKNRKKKDIVLEIQRVFSDDWKIIETSHEYEMKEARLAVFKVKVPADKEVKVTYRVRVG